MDPGFNYRVGLFVQEEIVNADADETLNDNSQDLTTIPPLVQIDLKFL